MSEIPHYLLEADYEGWTAGADDPDFTPEKAKEIIKKVFGIGYDRRKQLEKLLKQSRDGEYYVPYSNRGYQSDFHDQANYDFLKENFPWLHADGTSIGIDPRIAEEDAGDLERYLAKIPDDSWNSFVEAVESLEDYPLLDEERASELEMEETSRWMEDDGLPDLKEALRKEATDAFSAFVIGYLSIRMAFDFCEHTGRYPEAQGEGSVWMEMKDHVEPEHVEWALAQFPNLTGLRKKWARLKRDIYEKKSIAKLFDEAVVKNAVVDADTQAAYSRLGSEGLYHLFLKLVPDSAYGNGDDDPMGPNWYPTGTDPNDWSCSMDGMDELTQSPRVADLLRNSYYFEPENHPELPLGESADDEDEPGLSPEAWIKQGGNWISTPAYQDANISIILTSDSKTLEKLMGITRSNYMLAEGAYVVLDRRTRKAIAAYVAEDYGLYPLGSSLSLQELASRSKYGESIKKGFFQIFKGYWDQAIADDRFNRAVKSLAVIRQAAGDNAVKDLLLASGEEGVLENYGMFFGMAAVKSGDYEQAAKYLKRAPTDFTAKGLWCYTPDFSALSGLFKYEEAAEEILSGEAYNWLDSGWDISIDLDEAARWLNKDALAYIRKLFINRDVFFPDGGPDRAGGWETVTSQMLSEYSDADLLDWVVDPSQEELDASTYDDIREAIVNGARDMLSDAGRDQMETKWRNAALNELGVSEHKFVDDPKRKGRDLLALLVPWDTILTDYDKAVVDSGLDYSDSVEELLFEAHQNAIDMENEYNGPNWPDPRDASVEYYRETCSNRLLKLPLTKAYQDPAQIDLPLGERSTMKPHQVVTALLESHSYSVLMIDAPPEVADLTSEWGRLNIPEESLYQDQDGDMGMEEHPHVTVKFGLTSAVVPPEVYEIAHRTQPFPIYIGKISLFTTSPDFDVVKLDVESPWLRKLNAEISSSVPNEDRHPEYAPHLTIAYVKKGSCDSLAGTDIFPPDNDREFMAYGMIFKGPGDDGDSERTKEVLLFSKVKQHALVGEAIVGPTQDEMAEIDQMIDTAIQGSHGDPKLFIELANDSLNKYGVKIADHPRLKTGAAGVTAADGVYISPDIVGFLRMPEFRQKLHQLIQHELVHGHQMAGMANPEKVVADEDDRVTPGGAVDQDAYLQQKQEVMAWAATLVDEWRTKGLSREEMLARLRSGDWGIASKYWLARRKYPATFNKFVRYATDYVNRTNEAVSIEPEKGPFDELPFPADPDRMRRFLNRRRRKRPERPIL